MRDLRRSRSRKRLLTLLVRVGQRRTIHGWVPFATAVGLGFNGSMHDTESQGSKERDHVHPRHHFIPRAHRDWRVWVVVLLMVAIVLVYVFSNNLSLRPGRQAAPSTPAVGAP